MRPGFARKDILARTSWQAHPDSSRLRPDRMPCYGHDMLVVHVRRDGQELRTHHFEQSEISIGRVHGQDIELPASNVSRRHARIAWRGDRVTVTDNGSTHGTLVNGTRLYRGSLDGRFSETHVQICSYQLEFEITEGITSKSPQSSAPEPAQAEVTGPVLPSATGEHQGPPTRPSLRKLIDQMFPSDDELEAFCLDYFPETQKCFAAGMSHLAKQNLLLQKVPRADVMRALRRHSHEKVRQYQHVLEYEAVASE